jgi:hypothetical protein
MKDSQPRIGTFLYYVYQLKVNRRIFLVGERLQLCGYSQFHPNIQK